MLTSVKARPVFVCCVVLCCVVLWCVVLWCCGVVVWCGVWCGGVVVWWCGGVVVWWCGGVVVWWCGVVCGVFVQDFRGCAQDLGAPPDPPPPAPPPPDRPKFRVFSLPPQFSFFLPLLEGSFRGILVVFEALGPEMCTFRVLGLSCEAPAAENWPNSSWPKSSMTPGTPSSPPPSGPPSPFLPPSPLWTPLPPRGHPPSPLATISQSRPMAGARLTRVPTKPLLQFNPPVVQDSPRTAQSRP